MAGGDEHGGEGGREGRSAGSEVRRRRHGGSGEAVANLCVIHAWSGMAARSAVLALGSGGIARHTGWRRCVL
jgi:hypothetical protein